MTESLSTRWRDVQGLATKNSARNAASHILGFTSSYEKGESRVIFGGNASVMLQELSVKYRPLLKDGDEIIISLANHTANILPWLALANDCLGVKVIWWNQGGSPENNNSDINTLLSTKTKLVVATGCSNVFGVLYSIQDLAETVASFRKTLVKSEEDINWPHVIVDGVASAAHRYADLDSVLFPPNSTRAGGIDFYVVSFHKLFGPHAGALVGRTTTMDDLELSSRDDGGRPKKMKSDSYSSRFWEKGTVNFEGCAGVVGLLQYFTRLAKLESNRITLSAAKEYKELLTQAYRNIDHTKKAF